MNGTGSRAAYDANKSKRFWSKEEPMIKRWWAVGLVCLLAFSLCAGLSEDAAQYAPIAGIWYDEDGTSVLEISPDGDFTWEGQGYAAEGYLVLAQESDGLWDGPRYVLYGVDEEPLPDDVCLLIDPEYPDEIVLSSGETASLYLREGVSSSGAEGVSPSGAEGVSPSGAASGAEADVTVQWLDETEIDPDVCGHFAADKSEWAADVVFTAQTAVRDFKVLALDFLGVDEAGAVRFSFEELYCQAELTPEKPLAVAMAFYGDIPNNGVAYTDENGLEHRFSVEMSGESGELYLAEIE